jgi:hypothetical protein
MDNPVLILIEIVSALLCFVLLRFMIRPYLATGETRYLGLPLGFGFLGVSYLMSASLYFVNSPIFIFDLKWFELFTESFAFAFLVATYFFSKKPSGKARLWWNATYAALLLGIVVSYLVVIEEPQFGLPSYKTSTEVLMLFNIACLAYISIHTIRSHISSFDAKTLWIPFAFLLLGVSEYSLLIWSVDGSFAAHVGGYFLRFASLFIFLFVAFRTFHVSSEKTSERGVSDEKASSKR